MKKNFKKHQGYYVSLTLLLLLGIVLTLVASPNIFLQTIIISLTIFFYMIWGILHHLINHELTSKVMIEYVLIGTLGISILFFMLMGGIL